MVLQPREARSESGVAQGGLAGSLLHVGPPAPKLQLLLLNRAGGPSVPPLPPSSSGRSGADTAGMGDSACRTSVLKRSHGYLQGQPDFSFAEPHKLTREGLLCVIFTW